jgi:UDP-GlcNAc:undecaprenyl-phosphate/decaprenyl-phosphate GlcNAc-1-phosphate transferase
VTRRLARRLLVMSLAGEVGWVAADGVRRLRPGGAARWERVNFRQQPVDLAGGPGAAAGLLTALAAVEAPAAFATAATAAALGLYDDLAGHTHARGLRGHLVALRRGVVTSGAIKMLGLVAVGAVAGPSRPRRAASVGTDVVLVAGTANLVNLLDLRPGRALKVVLAVGLPFAVARGHAGDVAAAATGVALAMLPDDLGERQMLGDCGANALGAAIGWALAARLGRPGRLLAAATVVGLTLISEKVSFTALIDRQPALAAIDRWGRQEP